MNKSAISSYETGSRTPNLEAVKLLADVFDVSVDYLLGKTENPHVFTEERKRFLEDRDYLTPED
jgi:transcriptional regulator with XRE-family HTH domain